MKFYIVDAFTEKKFGGNPAGVIILPEGADFPSDELCVKTAAELRYSETARHPSAISERSWALAIMPSTSS